MKIRRRSFPLFLLSLAACGSSHRTAVVTPDPTVVITSENALDVARTAMRGAFGVADVSGTGTGVLTATPPNLPAAFSLTTFLDYRLAEVAVGQVALPALITDNLPGTGGGVATRTIDDRDDDQRISTGDTITITFVAYVEGGLRLDGTMLLDEIVVAGDLLVGQTWRLTTRLHFVNLNVTLNGATQTVNGSLLCRREKRATVQVLELQIDQGLTVGGMTLMPGNTIAQNRYLLDFKIGRFGAGAVGDEMLGGVLTYNIMVPFTGPFGFPFSEAGVMRVFGANGTRLTINVQDLSNLEIAVDTDGDGMVDETLSVEWSEI